VGRTQVFVFFTTGTPHVPDLTKRITGINPGDVFSLLHRLPKQAFRLPDKLNFFSLRSR
jgi:hypothetical protein